jgi:hypothetical protein
MIPAMERPPFERCPYSTASDVFRPVARSRMRVPLSRFELGDRLADERG